MSNFWPFFADCRMTVVMSQSQIELKPPPHSRAADADARAESCGVSSTWGAPLIAIHTHPLAPFQPIKYMVRELIPHWHAMGIATAIVPAAVAVKSAHLAMNHVDSTRPLADFTSLGSHYPRLLNSEVGSIEKRVISQHLVTRGDGYDGPVVVKTNGNFGGQLDYQLERAQHPVRSLSRAVRDRLPWMFNTQIAGKKYRIFESARDVPAAVWWNDDFVVERLLCERDGDLFVLRSWFFFGDQNMVLVNHSTQPIVHRSTVVSRTVYETPPREMLEMRARLGFDFGKFDFTIVNGVAHLLDANKTPTVGNLSEWPWFADRMQKLSLGIEGFLNR
jgi:hypothetical protein